VIWSFGGVGVVVEMGGVAVGGGGGAGSGEGVFEDS